MALTVEDGSGSSTAEAYDTVANATTYYVNRGYVGSFASGSPVMNGPALADATSIAVDGGSGTESVLEGDKFRIAGVPGVYTATKSCYAVSGNIADLTFTPALATRAADGDALTIIAASEQSLRRGTQMFDERYRTRLKGTKSSSGQALAWPRSSVTDEDGNSVASDTIPNKVKYASFEVARAVDADLDPEDTSTIKRVKAGSVEVEFQGAPTQRSMMDHADELMRPYIVAQYRLVRA